MKGAAEKLKQKGGIKKVKIEKEDIAGDTATVQFTVEYGNGTTDEDTQKLIKENGAWRITVSK